MLSEFEIVLSQLAEIAERLDRIEAKMATVETLATNAATQVGPALEALQGKGVGGLLRMLV